jgi:hypothetical protein
VFWWGNLRESGYFKRQWRRLEVNIKICLQGIGWRRGQDLCGSEQLCYMQLVNSLISELVGWLAGRLVARLIS